MKLLFICFLFVLGYAYATQVCEELTCTYIDTCERHPDERDYPCPPYPCCSGDDFFVTYHDGDRCCCNHPLWT
ncbi:CLUMA_CG003922, isoform A [Clunio marinus]|uniref:CLUMA_CG003922, isoform A n=1 Tax=Clunio marinus TaxID=568069 RepID=A0A1J1HQ68_9DIPT|nr:CLUMA_CG003922, isoform A [Clunio marinus]